MTSIHFMTHACAFQQFGGFSADSLADRMIDAQASVLITSDGVWRGEKIIHLKEISDKAIAKCGDANLEVKHCIVVNHLPRLAVNKADENTNQSPTKRKQYDYTVRANVRIFSD